MTTDSKDGDSKDGNYKQYLAKLPDATVFSYRVFKNIEDAEKGVPPLRTIHYVGVMMSYHMVNPDSSGSNTVRVFDAKRVASELKKEWRCSECSERARKYSNFVFANGPHLCQHNNELLSTASRSAGKLVGDFYKTFNKTTHSDTTWTLKVVSEEIVEPMIKVGEHKEGGGAAADVPIDLDDFKHHYIPYSDVTDGVSVDIDKYDKTFQKYVPLMSGLFAKIRNLEQFRCSLNLFIKIAGVATYAKELLASSNWLKRIVDSMTKSTEHMNKIELMQFIGSVICSAPITNDDIDPDTGEVRSYAIPFFHQINKNSFELLEKACDEAGMKSMMEERFNPLNYKRSTAPITEKKLDIAEKKLGHVENTILTITELETHEDTVAVGLSVEKCAEEKSVYASMRTKLQRQTKGIGGFAGRADASKRSNSFSHITTIRTLMGAIRAGDVKRLEVSTRSLHEVYVAKTSIDDSKLIGGFKNNKKVIWCFLRGERIAIFKYGGGGFCNVTHIKHLQAGCYTDDHGVETIKHNHLFFIVEGTRNLLRTKSVSNCCFKDFLNSAYERSCGDVFEKINKENRVKVPSSEDCAFGLGTSIKDIHNNLTRPIDVKINGSTKVLTISQY